MGNRLVVQEYQGRTQLFLEGLPIRRGQMVGVKFALGAVYLTSMALGGLALLALKSAFFAIFFWSLLFTMGFLGRLRIPVYIALVLLLTLLQRTTALEISEVGPFALLNSDTFAFERQVFPWRELAQTLVAGGAIAGLGFGLALGTA